jgi:hypothetical protein
MKARFTLAIAIAITAVLSAATAAFAGSPHFINNAFATSINGNTLTVSGKEAGLGDEAQVHIVVTATAACINPGGQDPAAANKESVSAEGDFPVQNGKAEFSLDLTATFKPDCTPPMSVQWSDVTVSDTTNGISAVL